MATARTPSARTGARRVPPAVTGAAAGIATGLLEGVVAWALLPVFVGFTWWIGFMAALAGLGIAAAVSVAVMRALAPSIRRAARVPVSGVAVRLANLVGHMVNISASGTLVRVNGILPIGSEWPLLMQHQSPPVELWTRIARVIEPVSAEAEALPRPEYAIGLTFRELPPPAKHAVVQLCGGAFDDRE